MDRLSSQRHTGKRGEAEMLSDILGAIISFLTWPFHGKARWTHEAIWIGFLLLITGIGVVTYRLDQRYELRLRWIRNKRLRAEGRSPAWIRAENMRLAQERRRKAGEQKQKQQQGLREGVRRERSRLRMEKRRRRRA